VSRFERFGLEHGVTLALLAVVALLLTLAARRSRLAVGRLHGAVRVPLAALLVAGLGYALADALPLRGIDWLDFLPLELCDLAVVVAVWALLGRSQLACEILYFWGLSGTLIAMFTPDVGNGFPDSRCVSFFALHGAVAIAAVVMVFGVGISPRPGANLRVFWMTNAYAAVAGLIDVLAGKNYLYLRDKPSQPSILDVMGPWPWYILAADALAFVLFWLLMVPFRGRSR
jgi:hypothetical integral membrane protein (TIGR02206 family)